MNKSSDVSSWKQRSIEEWISIRTEQAREIGKVSRVKIPLGQLQLEDAFLRTVAKDYHLTTMEEVSVALAARHIDSRLVMDGLHNRVLLKLFGAEVKTGYPTEYALWEKAALSTSATDYFKSVLTRAVASWPRSWNKN